MRRALLVTAAVVTVAPAVVAFGCSTSNVHPAAFGDCLEPGTCANSAPRGEPVDGGGEGGVISFVAEKVPIASCRGRTVDVSGLMAQSEGNAALFGTVVFEDQNTYGPLENRYLQVGAIDAGAASTHLNFATLVPDAGAKASFTWMMGSVPPGTFRIAALAVGIDGGIVASGFYNGTADGTQDPASGVLIWVENNEQCVQNVYVKARKVGAGQPSDAGDGGG